MLKNRSLTTLIFFFICRVLFSQNNVGIGTNTPDASSKLDIVATDKGLLVPRVTTAQRLAIVSPANGLLVYDTSLSCFYYYDSANTIWQSLCNLAGPPGATGPTGPSGIVNVLYTQTNSVTTTTSFSGIALTTSNTALCKSLIVSASSGQKVFLSVEGDYVSNVNAGLVLALFKNGTLLKAIRLGNTQGSVGGYANFSWMDPNPVVGNNTYELRMTTSSYTDACDDSSIYAIVLN